MKEGKARHPFHPWVSLDLSVTVTPNLSFSLKVECQKATLTSLSVSQWTIQVGIVRTQVVSKWVGLRDKRRTLFGSLLVFLLELQDQGWFLAGKNSYIKFNRDLEFSEVCSPPSWN